MIDIVYRCDPNASNLLHAPVTPEEAKYRLCAGNRDFVNILSASQRGVDSQRVIPIDLEDLGISEGAAAPHQSPFAVVLGCSDARVPTELIFSEACNALFVVRVAGNVLGSECLGSIDYALDHLRESVKLLLVLGHSGCGAVTAAVDAFLEPTHYLSVASSHAIRAIVDRLFVAVQAGAQSLAAVHGASVHELPGYRAALIEIAVSINAALTAKTLSRQFRELIPEKVLAAYGVYHLHSRTVGLPDWESHGHRAGLFDPPRTEAEFRQVALELASSPDLRALLGAHRR